MYDVDDIARSVSRLLAETLGQPWRLDLERREVRDDERPAGLIEVGQVRTRRARTSVPQGDVEEFAPLTLTLYPALDEPQVAGRAARLLAAKLTRLITVGADGPLLTSGRRASGPERWPLYDYSAVKLSGTAAERRGPARAHDVLWLEDYGVRAIQDPADARRWTVVADVRLSWERPGAIVPGPAPPIATEMPGVWVGEVNP